MNILTFNSVEDAIRYIEMVVNQAMYDMADEMKEIMDTVTQEQVEGWTYQIFDSVIAQAYGREAIAEFTDNGHWVSWNGQSVGNPIKFLEAGTTVGRDASNIMEESFSKCQIEIPMKLKEYLLAAGIPIE